MTKEALWLLYVEKNPCFIIEGGKVTLSTRGLKKLFDQSYDIGFKAGEDSKSIFEQVFGIKNPAQNTYESVTVNKQEKKEKSFLEKLKAAFK